MTRSLFSNLYKAGFVHLGEDARVIDMNAILEKRLKEEAERRSRQPEHELVAAQDGFTEGLNAEKVDVLLEPDAEVASQQNASIQEQEQLKQEIEEARNRAIRKGTRRVLIPCRSCRSSVRMNGCSRNRNIKRNSKKWNL